MAVRARVLHNDGGVNCGGRGGACSRLATAVRQQLAAAHVHGCTVISDLFDGAEEAQLHGNDVGGAGVRSPRGR